MVERVAAGAPVDDRRHDRERQGGAIVEERRARERADRADRDRTFDLGELERERLAGADEREDREQADVVGAAAPDEAGGPSGDADSRHRRDDDREPAREREERRAADRVRLRMPPLLARIDRLRRRQRHDVVAVLADRVQLRAALGGQQQRLAARAEHAVAPLQLRPVHGAVGLMDQLVRVEAVLRIPGHADRHRGPDRLRRGLDLELALRHGAADPLRDLERLLRQRLRQEDRELLAAETRRDVVVAQLGAEDLRDSLQHRVAGEMPVAVVDVAQQVEVGHDQRHRALEARRARDLRRKCRCEVARVVETRLRIDARLRLQLRHAERAVDDDERCERGEDQPGVPAPEGGERHAEDREHEVDREALEREHPRLAERVVAPELEDDAEEDVVDGDPDDAGCEPGDGEARAAVRDHAGAVHLDHVSSPPRRERVQRVVRDVEALDRPRVPFLQPLRDRLHERDQHEQLGRQEQRRRDDEDDRGVVHRVPR